MQEFIGDPMAVLVMLVVVGLILSEIEKHYIDQGPFGHGKTHK